MFFSRSLVVLAMMLALVSTITALPVAGTDDKVEQLCIFKRDGDGADGGEATAQVAC